MIYVPIVNRPCGGCGEQYRDKIIPVKFFLAKGFPVVYQWGMEPNKTRDALLPRIDDFRERHGLSEWHFGSHALANPKWLSRLRDTDIGVSLQSIEKAEAFMRRADNEAA